MKTSQEFCCAVFGVLLFFHLHSSCLDMKAEVLYKAVGSSLNLISDYPKDKNCVVTWKFNQQTFLEYDKTFQPQLQLFAGRIKNNENNVTVTIENLQLQDSGNFSIVTDCFTTQPNTKPIELHVQNIISDVQIQYNISWHQAKNMCTFHLQCQTSGNLNLSYNWRGYQVGSKPDLLVNISSGENGTFSCTANNSVSTKTSTETVTCKKEPIIKESEIRFLKFVVILVVAGIVGIIMFTGIIAMCFRWRRHKGKGESEADITVYEDVNCDTIPKKQKRSESVVNGMSIYETVGDTTATPNMPQTLYDKINYHRKPVGRPNTSAPYHDVL